jgi:hypothetical protein
LRADFFLTNQINAADDIVFCYGFE